MYKLAVQQMQNNIVTLFGQKLLVHNIVEVYNHNQVLQQEEEEGEALLQQQFFVVDFADVVDGNIVVDVDDDDDDDAEWQGVIDFWTFLMHQMNDVNMRLYDYDVDVAGYVDGGQKHVDKKIDVVDSNSDDERIEESDLSQI